MWGDSYLIYYLAGIILIPGIILGLWAQHKVNVAYEQYSDVFTTSGIKASELIRKLLDENKLNNISVTEVLGQLTDHYDSRNEVIALSEGVYNSSSVSALGIAAHEFGHALQKQDNYFPMKIRSILVPVTNFVSKLLMPLVIIGLAFNIFTYANGIVGDIFILSGVIVFGLSILFNLITLPVEFNASKRALIALNKSGTMTSAEIVGAKQVLSAAALTYIAALVISILNFLRFLLSALLSSRRRR